MKALLLSIFFAFPYFANSQVVEEMAVCEGVAKLQPIRPRYIFKPGEKAYCWFKISGATPGETLYVEWYWGEQMIFEQQIKADYSNMRSFTYKELKQKGLWKVMIRNAQGKPLRAMKIAVGEVPNTTDQEPVVIEDPKP